MNPITRARIAWHRLCAWWHSGEQQHAQAIAFEIEDDHHDDMMDLSRANLPIADRSWHHAYLQEVYAAMMMEAGGRRQRHLAKLKWHRRAIDKLTNKQAA
ncbi:hypothetical protein N8I74_15830 [Chitiniphilus purpureus]|uniref:Uncharacterized protein n=1 Tax=Chitiniphilus purpureus TaxID=2981137 RepID=A0ABY6DS93_9NEIS|nr:hypothetical protein [Chitiniphilus sp. CD1]UXY14773.1 hypothetical protein N8I74_15830 [Chitiniphilus sp. CD1]